MEGSKELIEQGTFEQTQQFGQTDFIQYADVSAEMEDVYERRKAAAFFRT